MFFTDDEGNQETRDQRGHGVGKSSQPTGQRSTHYPWNSPSGPDLRVPILEFFSSVSDPDGVSNSAYRIRCLLTTRRSVEPLITSTP